MLEERTRFWVWKSRSKPVEVMNSSMVMYYKCARTMGTFLIKVYCFKLMTDTSQNTIEKSFGDHVHVTETVVQLTKLHTHELCWPTEKVMTAMATYI